MELMKVESGVKVAVCAICRNERAYVEEWVSYYKSIGFDDVFIYDNVSDDGTSELLVALDAVGEIKRVYWPRKEGIPPQRDAYGHFINEYSHNFDYVLICDLDEFLVVDQGNVKTLIDQAEALHDQIGAIALPWLMFGSGGEEKERPGLVIERFKKCEGSVARSVKTLFATKNTYNMRTHICDLLNGVYLDNTLSVAQWDQKMPIKLKKPEMGHARIHHYYTKSKEEWLKRRAQPKADRAKIELKNVQEYEKYSGFSITNDQASMRSAEVKANIESLRKKVSSIQVVCNEADIEVISINGDWIFGAIKNLKSDRPQTVRVVGEMSEAYVRSVRISDNLHIFTYKNKWRNTYGKSFQLSLVGASRSKFITPADYPAPMVSLKWLAKFMASAEDHIFAYALLALSDSTIHEVAEVCRRLKFTKNKKFTNFFIALSSYALTKDLDSLLVEVAKEDEDFRKMIFDSKKSPYLSKLSV
ncbi:glycosyltransferase family 2 protein [Pseudomonas putida]|uniref:glycosyltransferase family 2 protein n=2 Tax=Pseudomonas TaxID=286 RepID=UPI0015E11505|nr:glycosyltransferase family 2 protein [Pseudomonas putida]